jgi:hypothetical protein
MTSLCSANTLGGIYNELVKSITSLCSANTLTEFGIYNQLAKFLTSLCSANTLAEFIMSLQKMASLCWASLGQM